MRNYQLFGSLVRVSSVPIAFFLIKYFNIPELGLVAVLFSVIMTHTVCLFIAHKIVGFSLREYMREVVLPLLIVFVLCLTLLVPIRFLMEEGAVRFLIVGVSSVIVVGLSFFYIAFNESERQLVIQLLKPVLSRLLKRFVQVD